MSLRSSSSSVEAQRFHGRLALFWTLATLLLFLGLSLLSNSLDDNRPSSAHNHRLLQEDDDDAENFGNDYSAYSCHSIYQYTPDAGDDQCLFARTCNDGDGLWAPFVFCNSSLKTNQWCWLLSPVIVVWLGVLFRLLGTTAEDYFSPALEMFSLKLGLPPRFAGVSLLALGNGAADVSATISAITNDADHGYQLSLGALTGASMVITCVVGALVVIVAGGVPCRGALVRDVLTLALAILMVWRQFATGTIGPESITLFLSTYFAFVILVLVADVYHRAVVLPRQRQAALDRERLRQQAEQERLEASVPGDANPASSSRPLSSVLTALSNYDRTGTIDGWGIESDQLASERPVVLHGAHGILHDNQDSNASADTSQGEYTMLEDVVDRVCVESGSLVPVSSNWSGAFADGRQELMDHAKEVWDDIVINGDINFALRTLMILEIPFVVLRKLTVPIPCDGYYVRALVALSLAISPLWFLYYLFQSGVTVIERGAWAYSFVYVMVMWVTGTLTLRFGPVGEGNMSLYAATPIALYGFVMAATWIDTIADALVSLLDFIGLILRIPGPVVGLTILAWGNSSADLSANMTMARKGLANMAMTACFAGPVFNILVGLGFGFSSLATKTGEMSFAVDVPHSVMTGFIFTLVNTVCILTTGLAFGKGRIPRVYGYFALALYAVYAVVSIVLQYKQPEAS